MVLVDDAVVMTVTRKASAVVAAQKLRGTLQRKVDARIAERTDASGTVLHGDINIGNIGAVSGKTVRRGVQRQLQGEDFTMEYMERQLDLTEVFFEPPQAEVVRQLLLERGSLGNVRRAAAFYKLQRYSYNGSGDSYGVGSCDIRRFFRDLWECSHRLKDAVLENKDFESIITARNDPQTVVYCDPPYYEAECYTVEFPRSDHQRLHDVLVKHTGFAMVSYNNCPYIRELYDDFFIYEVERPNSQSKKKNNKYREYIMTNYDPRTFAPQMSFFGDYDSRGKSCRLVHTPQRPLKV